MLVPALDTKCLQPQNWPHTVALTKSSANTIFPDGLRLLLPNTFHLIFTFTELRFRNRHHRRATPALRWCPEFFALSNLAERRPIWAQAVIVSGWAFKTSIDRYLFVDHSLPAM
jgi:hypothetical protein